MDQVLGQVVLLVLAFVEGFLEIGPELRQRQQRIALVVEALAVGRHVIKPDEICAATAAFGEQQDRRAPIGIGAQHPARR